MFVPIEFSGMSSIRAVLSAFVEYLKPQAVTVERGTNFNFISVLFVKLRNLIGFYLMRPHNPIHMLTLLIKSWTILIKPK